MKVISIGTDRNVFLKDSSVRARILEYGTLFDELHVVVFSRRTLRLEKEQIAKNVWLYPTNSRLRMLYVRDALKVCDNIVKINRLSSANTVVTCQDPFETGLVGDRLKIRYGIPLHVQIHTDFLSPFFTAGSLLNKSRVQIAKRILARADAARAVSERVALSISSAGLFKKPDVLPIFVDKKAIEKAPIEVDLKTKYPKFHFIILMASRLTKEKNIPLALNAFKEILLHYPHAGMVIVGSGPYLDNLKNLAKSLKISENVVFEPWSNNLISYYKTANLFLLTSNYEGYGMTIVEALSGHCPTLSTDVGIASQVLKDGQSFVCPVGDQKCLAQKMKEMIEDNQVRELFTHEAFSRLSLVTCVSKKEYLEKYKASIESAMGTKQNS